MTKRDSVAKAAMFLAKILEKPEPGLASWHDMAERAYQALLKEVRADDNDAEGRPS